MNYKLKNKFFSEKDLISIGTFGEIFLTDARPERSKTIMGKLDAEVKFFEVEKGEVKK
ncbi:hypothetical protein [Algoriphagus alkaliphilus]|uniref:hypothetical protein n=1 Tax=Algoriphagus alkaliphilus TaxID=279824 RepID=UPI000A6BB69F|nr:hypothetical protein [Algoriphagus alkaliphilus]